MVISVTVQNKDQTKCVWTHEIFFPLFFPPCYLSVVCWACFFLPIPPPPLFCFLNHIRFTKCIMLRATVWESPGKFTETLGLIVIRCYIYAYKNVHLEYHTCGRTAMFSIFGQERANAHNDSLDFSCGFPNHATLLLQTKGRILLKCM